MRTAGVPRYVTSWNPAARRRETGSAFAAASRATVMPAPPASASSSLSPSSTTVCTFARFLRLSGLLPLSADCATAPAPPARSAPKPGCSRRGRTKPRFRRRSRRLPGSAARRDVPGSGSPRARRHGCTHSSVDRRQALAGCAPPTPRRSRSVRGGAGSPASSLGAHRWWHAGHCRYAGHRVPRSRLTPCGP